MLSASTVPLKGGFARQTEYLEEIAANGYDLTVNKYKKVEYVPEEYPSTLEILTELHELEFGTIFIPLSFTPLSVIFSFVLSIYFSAFPKSEMETQALSPFQ